MTFVCLWFNYWMVVEISSLKFVSEHNKTKNGKKKRKKIKVPPPRINSKFIYLENKPNINSAMLHYVKDIAGNKTNNFQEETTAFEPLAPTSKTSFWSTISDILPRSVLHIRTHRMVPHRNLLLSP